MNETNQVSKDTEAHVRDYRVGGIGCGACRLAIREFVGHVPGVAEVEVDVRTGAVRVYGDGLVDAEIREAIEEAGYEVLR
jgi:copper chaperone CopZ